jgi:hypothetical protein
MSTHGSKRLFLVAAVVGTLAVFAAAFFVALTVRSVVADPGGPVPSPVGHAWTELQGHGDDADACYVSTENDQAFEVRVDGERALRLEPDATSPNVIGGYSDNSVASGVYGATIGGGGATGFTNRVTDSYGTVGGGYSNLAGDNAGTTDDRAWATVGGGEGNSARGDHATVSGGEGNTASGNYATVGGGHDNTAAGDYSFAAGRRAKANNDGCFVWGDSTDGDIICGKDNRFMIRASGGVYMLTSADHSTGAYLAAGSGSWSDLSDRNLKENFTPVDGQELLASLAEIPISTWNYKAQDSSIRHMGPVAQDFYAAFGLGESDTSISSVDPDGVALAAIQGLYELSQVQAERIDALEARVAALEGEAGVDGGSAGLLSSAMPAGWLLFGALFLGGLVLVQRRRAGGRR